MSFHFGELDPELSAADRAAFEAVEGTIFDIQRYSLHDGPGLRTNVFFKGCPLRCGWCSNPESQQVAPEVAVFAMNCIRCGQFAEPCPDRWQPQEDAGWQRALLPDYRLRAEACPARGVRWIGERRSAGSVMSVVRRDVPFYEGEGGMTLTGGEPLLQSDLAEALLRLARVDCINTAIETTGAVPWHHLERCLPFLDTVLFDLKHVDPEIHRQYTGADNALILNNLRRLSAERPERVQVIVRVPLIPGFNASHESVEAIAAFIARLELPLARVDLLPYHLLGRSKYAALGRVYPWDGHEMLSEEQVADLARRFEHHRLTVTVGG